MLNSIVIKIKDQEYVIKKSYRSLLLFEQETGRSVEEIKQGVSDLMMLFWCILKANNQETFKYTFNEFIDVLDDDPDSVEVFNDYLLSEAKKATSTNSKKK